MYLVQLYINDLLQMVTRKTQKVFEPEKGCSRSPLMPWAAFSDVSPFVNQLPHLS